MKIRYRQDEKEGITHVVLGDGSAEGISITGKGDEFNANLGVAIAMLKADAWTRLDPQSCDRVNRAFTPGSRFCTWVVPDSVLGLLLRYRNSYVRAIFVAAFREMRGGKRGSAGLMLDHIGRAFLTAILEEIDRYERWPEYTCEYGEEGSYDLDA